MYTQFEFSEWVVDTGLLLSWLSLSEVDAYEAIIVLIGGGNEKEQRVAKLRSFRVGGKANNVLASYQHGKAARDLS